MTEFDIQEILFDKFKELNTSSGKQYLKQKSNGDYSNVHFPNETFSVPNDKRWFDLTFKSDEPSDASLGKGSQNRFYGVLYIDIYTPVDKKETEVKAKYKAIARLFNDAELDYVDIIKVYISTKGNDSDSYRLQVAINWEADIDKE